MNFIKTNSGLVNLDWAFGITRAVSGTYIIAIHHPEHEGNDQSHIVFDTEQERDAAYADLEKKLCLA